AERIVAAMDELLFPLCQPGDLLLTHYPMDPALADYLARIGFRFERNRLPLDVSARDVGNGARQQASATGTAANRLPPRGGAAGGQGASVFGLLSQSSSGEIRALLDGVRRVAAYAILPDTEAFCRQYALPYDGPGL